MSDEKKIKINRLTRAEAYKLMRWIESNWERMKPLTRDESGKLATKELTFLVGGKAISQAVRDMGRVYPGKINRTSQLGARNENGRNTRMLANQVEAVARELERVTGLLGEAFNPCGSINFDILHDLKRGNHIPRPTDPAEPAKLAPGSVKPISQG